MLFALGIGNQVNAQIVNVCGTDTVLLKVANYQAGVIQWMESVDNENWVSIEGANDTTYKFFPTKAKYYKAQVKFSACPVIESQTSYVQIPPLANAGTDREISSNEVQMMANLPEGTMGEWSVLNGDNGSFSNLNDPSAIFSGADSLYSIVWTLNNTCGSSSDTISIGFVQNEYYNNIAIVDETDSIFSDTTQLNAGIYRIKFGNMPPEITESTVLVGMVGDGFLRKVESFTETDGVYTFNTSQGTLMDITVNGVFNLGTMGQMNNLKSAGSGARLSNKPTRAQLLTDPKFKTGNYYYEEEETIDFRRPGIRLKNASTVQGNSLISLDFDSEIWSNEHASLHLSGGYEFVPNIAVDFKIGTSWGIPKLKKVKVGMYNGTITSNYKVKFTANAETSLVDKPFELFKKSKTTTFVIGGTPVVVKTTLKFEGVLTADANAEMELIHGQTHVSTYTAGAEYSKGKWSFPNSKDEKTTMDNSIDVTGNLAQHFEIGPTVSFKVYSVVGPYVKARLNEDLEICAHNTDWQANFDISGSITVGAKAKVAGYKLFDVNKTWAKGFYNLQLPAKISYISGNNQYYNKGEELEEKIKVKVKSNKGFAVPGVFVYFDPQNGGSVSEFYDITDFNGEASTYWTPGDESMSYLHASVKNCDGDNLNKSPIVFNAISESSQLACAKSSFTASMAYKKRKWLPNYYYPKGTGGIKPYEYSVDGGETYTDTKPKLYRFAELWNNGNYHVFFVKDAVGCIAAFSYTVGQSRSDLQIETVSIGNQIFAKGLLGDPPYEYAIDDINGNYSADSVFVNVPLGGHSVYVKDKEGAVRSRIEYVSGTLPPVVADFAINKPVAEIGERIEFSDLSDNADSWLWDFGDGSTSTEQNPTHIYAHEGNYKVELTATEAHGFSHKKIRNILIGSKPTVDFSISDTIICIGKSVKFTNLSFPVGVNIYKRKELTDWIWDFGDGNQSEDVSPNHVYNSAGNKTVSLTVSNEFGANTTVENIFVLSTANADFSVDKTVAAVDDNIQFSALPQVTILSDTVVSAETDITTIVFDTITSDNASSWLWDFGDGTSSNEKNPIHKYTSAGKYNVKLTVTDPCGNLDAIEKRDCIEVGLPPVADFSVSDETTPVRQAVTFTNLSSNNPTSWFWDFGDGKTSELENATHTFDVTGSKTVALTVANRFGEDTKVRESYIEVGLAPEASFSVNNTKPTVGEEVTFTNLSSNNPTSWFWDFGDGTTSELENPIHTFNVAGNKTVLLIIANRFGKDTKRLNLEVGEAIPPVVSDFEAEVTAAAVGDEIFFMDRSESELPIDWLWDFGDGATSTEQYPMHAYNATGTYTVKLTVTDGNSTDTKVRENYIEIGLAPEASFSVNNTTPTVGEEVTFTNLSENNPTSWYWDFDDGTSSELENPTHTFDAAGSKTITLTVRNAFGESTKTLNIEIGEAIPPVVSDFEAEVTAAAVGDEIFFVDRSESELSVNWLWDFGDGATSTGQYPMHAYNATGTYTVKLTVTDGNSTDTKVRENYIEIGLDPEASFSVNNTTPTVGEEVSFTDLSGNNPTSWFWDFGDGTTSEFENPTHTFDAAGSKTITLTVRNAFGESTKTLNIEIGEAIPPVVSDFEAEVTAAAVGDEIFFVDRSESELPVNWLWDFGDGATSTVRDPMHAYNATGTYTVKLTVSDGNSTDTKVRESYIEIGLASEASFSVNNTTPTVGEEVSFTDLSGNNPTSWFWDFSDGTTSELENPIHTFDAAGIKTITLTVRNAFGESTKTLNIEVTEETTFTDERDGTVYNIVTIGEQTWMAENLAWLPRIDAINEATYWEPTITPAYYVFDYLGNNINEAKATNNYKNYGAYYNEPAAKIAAPEGWHLPTLEEWQELISFLAENGYSGDEANILKSCRQVNSPNSGSCATDVHPRWDENTNNYGTDNFGFSALPAGEASGEMGWPGMNGIWWTYSTDESAGEAPVIIIDVNSGTVEISTDYGLKSLGYSIRCIKDK